MREKTGILACFMQWIVERSGNLERKKHWPCLILFGNAKLTMKIKCQISKILANSDRTHSLFEFKFNLLEFQVYSIILQVSSLPSQFSGIYPQLLGPLLPPPCLCNMWTFPYGRSGIAVNIWISINTQTLNKPSTSLVSGQFYLGSKIFGSVSGIIWFISTSHEIFLWPWIFEHYNTKFSWWLHK